MLSMVAPTAHYSMQFMYLQSMWMKSTANLQAPRIREWILGQHRKSSLVFLYGLTERKELLYASDLRYSFSPNL